ncbi:MAG: hypothetical protein JO144_06915 [Actinobacteria bacterium]|nr:hypothetical protein [Actinomycetota bacterium]
MARSSEPGGTPPLPRKAAKAVSAFQVSPRRAASRPVPDEPAPAGSSEVWQARIGGELTKMLRDDAEVLGLQGRTEIVKAALALLHRQAAEERMARSVAEYYGDATPPLPLGVEPADDRA